MKNFHHKNVSKNQKYENYWKLTVEYTDINKMQFRNTLSIIVGFIDKNPSLKENYDSRLYSELQKEVYSIYEKADLASTRKSINQMVKLGFILPKLKGYNKLTKSFLSAETDEKRSLIFSEVLYTCANFQSSVTKDYSNLKHINFFLKTLMYKKNQVLKKEEIIALISSDISAYTRGYMTEKELESQVKMSKLSEFENRKYNQISYFFNFLKYVPGISISEDKSLVWYSEDANIKLSSKIDVKRDPTLFRIMSENIKEESKKLYGGKVVCYLTKREQKGLVVSHIVPLAESLKKLDVETAYNYKNALLLEPNSDVYFDKFNLTFDKSGKPQYDSTVPKTFIEEREGKLLDSEILSGREIYLEQHYQKFMSKQNK